mmetsp:Transcript_47457/g.79460  ORF Transcript_47457/g.79460 Transcript_47457/m.79460 type:complete len:324 (+) Transcript_47457:1332-2303(+)
MQLILPELGAADFQPFPTSGLAKDMCGVYPSGRANLLTSPSNSSNCSAVSSPMRSTTTCRTDFPEAWACCATIVAFSYPMVGEIAVTKPMDFSTYSRQTSVLAVMPSMQRSANTRHTAVSSVMLMKSARQMMGSKALSCSCPASAAIVTTVSLPMVANATWLTTSGITGFTLPGMMEDPAWRAGRLISFSPARGPLDSSRRSFAVLDSFTATRLSTPETMTKTPESCVASTMSSASTHGMPASLLRCSQASAAYPFGALSCVPIAVPPRLISLNSGITSCSRSMSSLVMRAYVANSWPSVIGTASWSCVLPIFMTESNSCAFF